MAPRIGDLPSSARLAVAGFVVLLGGFQVLAQANLWVRDGGGALPGPTRVLWKYHGRPDRTRLDQVLDLSLPQTDPRAMWVFLDPDGPVDMAGIREAHDRVLSWVRAGAPKSGWADVEPIFTDALTCGGCHVPGGRRADLPFDTWEHTRVVTQPDRGMAPATLLTSAHNHLFAFAVLALLLGVGTAFTGLRPRLQVLLVLLAFLGAACDVGGWFLTKGWGAPWNLLVMGGGGLFGAVTSGLALLLLDEALLRGRVARALRLAAPR
jgi:hypothetical protein